jgi:hypothetical protein
MGAKKSSQKFLRPDFCCKLSSRHSDNYPIFGCTTDREKIGVDGENFSLTIFLNNSGTGKFCDGFWSGKFLQLKIFTAGFFRAWSLLVREFLELEMTGKLPVRAYYLKDDYVPDDESIAAFRERLQGMIVAVCAEEFVARPSYMGCRTCNYTDLCEANQRGE